MSGLAGAPAGPGGVGDDDGRYLAYLIFGGLALLLCAIVVVAITSSTGEDERAKAAAERRLHLQKLPDYWNVKRGDTYVRIAQKTGLTVEELETFNPYTDPSTIRPGQRVKLHAKVPPPKPKALGPKWFTLRSGDSFGSIAAKTGKSIGRLQRLNPKLKPTLLQPGDRVRLR
ncbi:MAG TPA: LysM peptidoglycan-binding domain-containing protein [Solirubrobacteraceae bacterium]|nr:LysM peptidoglycan-binding domain-containing protein [Solirubrobacteraceae bacterium]